jgi:uncharacterized membrane protein YphA (DoxX/SURF4 family)
MTKENLLSLVRHVVSIVGGILVARGLANDSVVLEATGAVVAIVAIIWSIKDHTYDLGSLEGAIRQLGTAVAATVTSWVGILLVLLTTILGQTDKLWRNATPKSLAGPKTASRK